MKEDIEFDSFLSQVLHNFTSAEDSNVQKFVKAPTRPIKDNAPARPERPVRDEREIYNPERLARAERPVFIHEETSRP